MAWAALCCLLPAFASAQAPARQARGKLAPAAADPPTPTTQPAPAKDGEPGVITDDAGQMEREVVAFNLQGPKFWQTFTVSDLEIIVTPAKQRFVPLLYILKTLRVKARQDDGQIAFQFEGAPRVVLQIEKGMIQIGEAQDTCPLIRASSIITREPDIFVPPDVLGRILKVQITWDEANYGFAAKIDRALKMWTRKPGQSMLGMDLTEVGADLPSVHGDAVPRKNSLDFVRLEARVRTSSRINDEQNVHRADLDSIRQSFWGGFAGGTYKLRFSEPSFHVDESGYRLDGGPPVKMDWGEWSYRFDHTEVAVGDSSFGLNDITMPLIRMTGIRVNGFTGDSLNKDDLKKMNYGLSPYFIQPLILEGDARAGSTVELIVNGRVFETQEVPADHPTKPGFGTYRFEDIRLTPGALHEIRIRIVDPDGMETVLEREVVGSALLLPEGESAYLAGIGTRRDVGNWSTEGAVAMGRWIHGLTPRLTVGGTLALQSDFFDEGSRSITDEEDRSYPRCGINMGGQVSWLATESLILCGDVAVSHGNGQGQYSDTALKIKADWFPTRSIHTHAQFFSFGSDFFDGQRLDLRDRRGFVLLGDWRAHKKLTLSATAGRIWNNLDGKQDQTLWVDFQNLRISSTVIPRTSVQLEADRLDQSWGDQPLVCYRLKVRATPFSNFDVNADVVTGDTLTLDDQSDFFSGLRLPGVHTRRTRQVSLTARKRLTKGMSLGAKYYRYPQHVRSSLFHSYQTQGNRRWQVRTELGWAENLRENTGLPFFENRLEYLFDFTGRNRLGVVTRLENEEWSVLAFASLNGLWAFEDHRPRLMTTRTIDPERGAITGKVFVDHNGNARLDPGEPGVKDIKVRIGRLYHEMTDDSGRFILPSIGRIGKVRVSLDMDTVPALYNVTHGTQIAELESGRLTEVNLALQPVVWIVGKVICENGGDKPMPLVGVRVYLIDAGTGTNGPDSYTAKDGSYYLGDVKPGEYILRVDQKTLPKRYRIAQPELKVSVRPRKDMQEVQAPDFKAAQPKTLAGSE